MIIGGNNQGAKRLWKSTKKYRCFGRRVGPNYSGITGIKSESAGITYRYPAVNNLSYRE